VAAIHASVVWARLGLLTKSYVPRHWKKNFLKGITCSLELTKLSRDEINHQGLESETSLLVISFWSTLVMAA
jgi:hypothetical protein